MECTDGVTREFSLTMPLFHTPKPLRRIAVADWAAGVVNEAQCMYFNGTYANDRVAKKDFHFGYHKEQRQKSKDTVLIPHAQILQAYAVAAEFSPSKLLDTRL